LVILSPPDEKEFQMVILYTVSLWKQSFPKKRSGRKRGDDAALPARSFYIVVI
jgi:hypothetical protein